MLMTDRHLVHQSPTIAVRKLTRHHLELAGLVVYFFLLAVLIVTTVLVMVFRPGAQALHHRQRVTSMGQAKPAA